MYKVTAFYVWLCLANICLAIKYVNLRIEAYGINDETASIKINNKEYASDKPGINIVTVQIINNNISITDQKNLQYESPTILGSLEKQMANGPAGSLVVYVSEADEFFAHVEINKRLAQLAFGSYATRKISRYSDAHVAVVVYCKKPCPFTETNKLPFAYFGDDTDFIKLLRLTYGCTQKTRGGNAKGACCVFPFIYDGNSYDKCIGVDYDKLWCSATNNYDKDRLWGECIGAPVITPMIRINTTTTTPLPAATQNTMVLTHVLCIILVISVIITTLCCLYKHNKLAFCCQKTRIVNCCGCDHTSKHKIFLIDFLPMKCCCWVSKLDVNKGTTTSNSSNDQYHDHNINEDRVYASFKVETTSDTQTPDVVVNTPDIAVNTPSNRTYASFKYGNNETTNLVTHTYEYIDPNRKEALNEYYTPFPCDDPSVYTEPGYQASPSHKPLLSDCQSSYTAIDGDMEPNSYEQLRQ